MSGVSPADFFTAPERFAGQPITLDLIYYTPGDFVTLRQRREWGAFPARFVIAELPGREVIEFHEMPMSAADIPAALNGDWLRVTFEADGTATSGRLVEIRQ